jgi:limonene-1,2-epoxide hydrolase
MDEFRSAVESRDQDRVIALMAEDVEFRSPVVYKSYHGRETVATIIRAATRMFKDFTYARQVGASDADDHALVFHARVGDREVEGCDFLHTNEEGLIDELFVMVRPLSAAKAVSEAMAEEMGREMALAESGEASNGAMSPQA